MENLILSKYGNDFMSLTNFEPLLIQVKNDISSNDKLLIDLKGVDNISPSFMTRFINRLYIDLHYEKIDIENANKRLEVTFKFAKHSLRNKKVNV